MGGEGGGEGEVWEEVGAVLVKVEVCGVGRSVRGRGGIR